MPQFLAYLFTPSSRFDVAHCVRDVRAKDRTAILHLYFADCRYSFRFINFGRLRELIAPEESETVTEKNRRKKRVTAAKRRCT